MRTLSIALALLLLPAMDAAASTIEYTDTYIEIKDFRFSGDPLFIGFDTPETLMTLPKFDPALGTLLSVDFSATVREGLQLDVFCKFAVFCSSEASLGVSSFVPLQSAAAMLGVDLGTDLSVSRGTSGSCDDFGFLAECQTSSGALMRSAGRSLTFTGADLAGFIGLGDISFAQPGCCGNLGLSVHQSGVPPGNDSEVALEAEGGDELLAELIVTAYEIGVGFEGGEARVFAFDHQTVSVTYTYAPPAGAVPEPATLSLLGVGVASVAYRRRGGAR